MNIFLMIVLAIASIVLIASILLQSGNSAGLSGSIGGGAEQLGDAGFAVGFGLLRERQVLAVGLALAGEGDFEVFLGVWHKRMCCG